MHFLARDVYACSVVAVSVLLNLCDDLCHPNMDSAHISRAACEQVVFLSQILFRVTKDKLLVYIVKVRHI